MVSTLYRHGGISYEAIILSVFCQQQKNSYYSSMAEPMDESFNILLSNMTCALRHHIKREFLVSQGVLHLQGK